MLKTTLQKSMLLTCFIAVTFASCKKELDVEPVTEQVAVAPKPKIIMLASTARSLNYREGLLQLN
jgi:hypothetical protein